MAGNGKGTKVAENDGKISTLIAQYIAIRDKLKEIDAHYETVVGPYKLVRDKLAGTMLEFLDSTGQESAKTDEGTVYARMEYSASLSDPDAFMDYVIKNGLFELMDRRANKTACRDHAEEHGTLPPGVKLSSIRNVGVRAS